MPRITNSGPNVDAYCEQEDTSDSWFDVCSECWESNYGLPINEWSQSDGSDPIDLQLWNDDPLGTETINILEHPCYEYDDYTCSCCGCDLFVCDA